MTERLGRGPWARLLVSAVLPDEGSSLAERGRVLVEEDAVRDLTVTAGAVAARVADCDVTIAAEPVPPRIWAAMTRYARGNTPLEAAVEGRAQSVQLEHLMMVDWEQPLVPRTNALARDCTCGRAGGCEHLAALAYAFAREIDRDPSVLLRWRGCEAQEEAEPTVPETPAVMPEDAWDAGPLPQPRPLRPLPTGAVLKRLGPSGLRVGGTDLAELLQRAYASFAASPRR
ncbi:MAG: hypothetical protein QOF45_79 [Gaiellaceae bacterium]|nr:hypothetical protein [Gaiellaceae bacterium]